MAKGDIDKMLFCLKNGGEAKGVQYTIIYKAINVTSSNWSR